MFLAWLMTAFNASNTPEQQEQASFCFVVLVMVTLLGHFVLLLGISVQAFRRYLMLRAKLKK